MFWRKKKTSVVFSYEVRIYDSDAPEDEGKDVVLWTPWLNLYPSAEVAAKSHYGLEIVEGDLWFFAADGSPLEANFSQRPFFYTDRNAFFPGVYTLRPGTGKSLQETLAQRVTYEESKGEFNITAKAAN